MFFIHSTVFLFVNLDGIFVPPSNWLHTVWIYFVCNYLKEFVFSHDKAGNSLKEYFHALEMEKRIYMWYLHIRRHFNGVIFLFWCENTMGDMLILINNLLRLNLVNFDWNWQTKCKKVLIAIDYNGHTDYIALIQYTLFWRRHNDVQTWNPDGWPGDFH